MTSRMLIAGALLLGLTGCVQSGSSGSRHELYDSLDGLVAATEVIITGAVTEQVGSGTTISTVVVGEALLPSGFDTATVTVRELGPPLLAVGDEYLLFLVPTELEGVAADEYFVTGAQAGVYRADDDAWVRALTNTGDVLPERITLDDVREATAD
jgi:hypothetical protein